MNPMMACWPWGASSLEEEEPTVPVRRPRRLVARLVVEGAEPAEGPRQSIPRPHAHGAGPDPIEVGPRVAFGSLRLLQSKGRGIGLVGSDLAD